MFLVYDAEWWKSLVNVGGAIIGFVITCGMYQVYPFDFSGYAVNWSWLVTTVLIVGMVVAVIAAIAESVRTVTSSNGSTTDQRMAARARPWRRRRLR